MSFTQTVPEFMNQVQSPLLPISKVKTEAPMIIKNETPESEIMEIGVDNILDSSESGEKIIPDIKDTDIVWHPLCEDLIKSQTVPEYLPETEHLESVETQVYVKTENSSFVKTENIIQSENLNAENTRDRNGSWSTGQGLVEVLASNEHSNALSKLETDEDSVLNFSKDLNSISVKNRKSKKPKKTDFAECYKTEETTLWEKEKEKIKVIKAPMMIHVEPYEYSSLAKDTHVCNHCQHTCNNLRNLKFHIKKMHKEVTTMYQCPYCPLKSKWKWGIQSHIIQKHKSAKDIQWFQCHLCDKKFKLKGDLTKHKQVHLTHEQMQDRLKPCLVCGKRFKAGFSLKKHMIFVHNIEKINKERDYITIQRQLQEHHIENTGKKHKKGYCCEICALLCSTYSQFKLHKLSHKTKADMDDLDLNYRCNKCDYKTCTNQNLNSHKLIHLKPEEIQYFYCYHCSYKCPRKEQLKRHIFTHHKEIKHHSKCDETKNKRQLERRYHYCDMCNYKTLIRQSLNRHKIIHLKPEEIQYFYCYHCPFKAKRKNHLNIHIFRHFKNGNVPFHCYICDFMTLKRESIIAHIKKHSKV